MHIALAHGRFIILAVAAGAVQTGFFAWLVAGRWPGWRWAAAAVATGLVLVVGAEAGRVAIGILSGLSHAAIYGAMLALFGGSLRQGRTPVVTLVADAAHGPLSPELSRYTRAVTWLWTGFAAAQLAASLVLLVFAPVRSWSVCVNGLDLPAVGGVFAAEYAYRRYRFRTLPRLSASRIRRAMEVLVPARAL